MRGDRESRSANIAGRAGRWSAQHPWRAIGLWLLFVAVSFALGHMFETNQLADAQIGTGQSAQAQKVIDAHFTRHAGESVLLQSPTLTATDPQFQAALRDVVSGVTATGRVLNLRSPLQPGNPGLVSPDGRSALVQFEVVGNVTDSKKVIQPVLDAVAAAHAQYPQLTIAEAGDASMQKAWDDTIGKDFKRAEVLSFPITLLVLLFAFGAVVAALLPLALSMTAIMAASGLLILVSQVTPVFSAASSVMLLIGLAVGVDYSLFYVKREREERAAGRGPEASLLAAAATSGRSVLISGLTVLVAMAGMFFAGSKIFVGFAEGTMIVVAAAVLGSLTVLPAMLSLLGDRVDRGRIPWLSRRRHAERDSRVWGAVLNRVLRRPAVSAVAALVVLLALASPALGIHTTSPDASDLPKSIPAVQTFLEMEQAFPGGPSPAVVSVSAPDVTVPAVQDGIRRLEHEALATGQMFPPVHTEVSADRQSELVYIPLAGSGQDAASAAALATLRNDVVPTTVGAVPGVRAPVTGLTAGSLDFNATMKTRFPLVVGFVLILALVLLLLAFRSLVVAFTAIVLNLLSVAAAYGVLVLVFQNTWAQGFLGFTSNGSIVSWLPLFLFVVLFGLSMDYHVFILSRIREGHDRGADTTTAVTTGIKSTAGVVTAAAVVMVFVFLTFATLSQVSMKELGVGLATAVLLDATVVRGVLLPSVMTLLGRNNWYLPGWLGWLPKVSLGAATDEWAGASVPAPRAGTDVVRPGRGVGARAGRRPAGAEDENTGQR